jgi:hypothetical protein
VSSSAGAEGGASASCVPNKIRDPRIEYLIEHQIVLKSGTWCTHLADIEKCLEMCRTIMPVAFRMQGIQPSAIPFMSGKKDAVVQPGG